MARDEGLEPPNDGTKTRCLTTWLIPINRIVILLKTQLISRVLYSGASRRSERQPSI